MSVRGGYPAGCRIHPARKDLTVLFEKDYITNFKESGYRSFHMIIEYPVQTALGQKKVLAEIQVRTLAMNFWATIEHSLSYKYGKAFRMISGHG